MNTTRPPDSTRLYRAQITTGHKDDGTPITHEEDVWSHSEMWQGIKLLSMSVDKVVRSVEHYGGPQLESVTFRPDGQVGRD